MTNKDLLEDQSTQLLLEVTKILIKGDSQKRITSCIKNANYKKASFPKTPLQKTTYWQEKRQSTREIIANSLLNTCVKEEEKTEISELSKLYMQSFDLMTKIGSEIILLTKNKHL